MKLFAPAKINLYLKVVGKRPDCYHELQTIMMPVSFGDDVYIEPAEGEILINAPGCGCRDEDNLAYLAADMFFRHTGISKGVSINIHKRIPAEAGLGGGSSDAASVLVGMNALFGAGLDEAELSMLAGRLGADCPFFIHGHSALMGSRGDVLLKDVNLEERAYLFVIPPFGISTKRVFSEYKRSLTKCIDRFSIEDNAFDMIKPEEILENDLEVVACTICPELYVLKRELIEAGALGGLMSGSGSTVFGVFGDYEHLCSGMSRMTRHDGYMYMPTTTLMGERYGDYGGEGISGKG